MHKSLSVSTAEMLRKVFLLLGEKSSMFAYEITGDYLLNYCRPIYHVVIIIKWRSHRFQNKTTLIRLLTHAQQEMFEIMHDL